MSGPTASEVLDAILELRAARRRVWDSLDGMWRSLGREPPERREEAAEDLRWGRGRGAQLGPEVSEPWDSHRARRERMAAVIRADDTLTWDALAERFGLEAGTWRHERDALRAMGVAVPDTEWMWGVSL